MTLTSLPEGRTVPTELGGGVAAVPINGMPGCYEAMLGWIEYQWPELHFEEDFNARAQRRFWVDRERFITEYADRHPEHRGQVPLPPELEFETGWPPSEYGVGDSPQQIMDHPEMQWVKADPREFIMAFMEVRREHQPERQGWRFHKWGTYIGEHDVEMEYLADQDGIQADRIDSVWVYHVVQVTAKAAA